MPYTFTPLSFCGIHSPLTILLGVQTPPHDVHELEIMDCCGVGLQVRVHNLNLWLDREGNPKGDRADATLLDAPWSVHAPKLILWAGAEALKATSVHLVLNR